MYSLLQLLAIAVSPGHSCTRAAEHSLFCTCFLSSYPRISTAEPFLSRSLTVSCDFFCRTDDCKLPRRKHCLDCLSQHTAAACDEQRRQHTESVDLRPGRWQCTRLAIALRTQRSAKPRPVRERRGRRVKGEGEEREKKTRDGEERYVEERKEQRRDREEREKERETKWRGERRRERW